VLSRTKWAIYEKEKFQGLVNHLKHFIDTLFELVPVDRITQDDIFKADIESILDLSQLRLVESATEDSYRAYSAIAASVIEASEAGTVDRQTLEEHLRDVGPLSEQNQPVQQQAQNVTANENHGEPTFFAVANCERF
jgi:hypothetical protein